MLINGFIFLIKVHFLTVNLFTIVTIKCIIPDVVYVIVDREGKEYEENNWNAIGWLISKCYLRCVSLNNYWLICSWLRGRAFVTRIR